MQVRILTYHMESLELKKFVNEVGAIVHSLNTIAVALSVMTNENAIIPPGLNISWKPSNVEQSKVKARTFACRSAYIYVAESLFEYLDQISKNPLWQYENINFQGKKKADRVYDFLKAIPNIKEEFVILSELLCHWRNRIVHGGNSNAQLSSTKIDFILNLKEDIYEQNHHFDIALALKNFDNRKVTLKDVSTLSTIVIKCCRGVDNYYFQGIAKLSELNILELLKENLELKKIARQPKSAKRDRQVKKWIEIHYPYLTDETKNHILREI